jgi:hypothetical protein
MHQLETIEGKEWIVSHLKMGPVKVTFTKKDGTSRVMNCTLQEGVIVPHEKKTDREKTPNEALLSVWDIDKGEWRSFRLDSVKQIEF